MSFQGDDAKLKRLQEAIAKTGEIGYAAALLRGAKEVAKMVRGEVRRGHDADQKEWAPLKSGKKTRTGKLVKPLRHILAGSDDQQLVRVRGTSFELDIKHPAAQFHQRGTRWMKARPLTPGEGKITAWWQKRTLTAITWAAYRFIRRGR